MLLLRPVPSRQRWRLALAFHSLALLAVVHSGAPLWLQAGAALTVLASFWHEFRGFRGRGVAVSLQLGAKSVALEIDGETVAASPPRMLHGSEWLLVLEFPLESARRRHLLLTLFPDSLAADELRRLRRWLHYESD